MTEACDAAKRGTRSNPCKFVLDAIMTCVGDDLNGLDVNGNSGVEEIGIEKTEARYLEWIVGTFRKRGSWPAGEWIAAVMEESLGKVIMAYEMGKNESMN